jgi:acetyl-CoA carboxylase beta subunit/acetyl-CoA carboxylase alpha subunit
VTPERVSAHELLDLALDPGSFASWDEPVVDPPSTADPTYRAELAQARERTGLDEAVLTGEGTIRGRRVAVLACEFGFLAGSIGVAGAERLVRGVERATREGLPLLASPVSGGTRMQEGTVAFLQMVKIAAAIAAHKAAGLPYLVYLRHPTTGGVLASWGSLGHVTVAQPGALVGFLGPRVYEALYGEPFPSGVQVSENLFAHGLVDAVLSPHDLAAVVDRTLNVLLAPREGLPDVPELASEPLPDLPAWDSITRSRRDERPGIRRLLRFAATDVVVLNGTAQGERDPGLLLALARFGGAPCVVLGQDRRGQTATEPLGPAALREARRGMRLAAELRLPLVTVIDTPGAALSQEAEQGGLAGEIARCLAELVTLEAPTLSVLLGQGSGGGALALVPADRVVAAQHAWLSPLPPEGASAIVHRDTEHAPQMAAQQGVRSLDLLAAGVVDRVVPEHPDAAEEPEEFCRRMGRTLQHELVRLLQARAPERRAARLDRYRRLGLPADAPTGASTDAPCGAPTGPPGR